MNAQQEKVNQAMAKIQEAQQILRSIEWTPEQIHNQILGEHLYATENKLDNAFGRMSTLWDACRSNRITPQAVNA